MKKSTAIFITMYFIVLILLGVFTYFYFFRPFNSTKTPFKENEIVSNKQTSINDCEEMNGWWRTLDSFYDITITAPEVNWGIYQGTIEKFKDTSTVPGDYTTKYVLVFKFEKDGYIKTEKYYIAEASDKTDYDYYMWYEGRSGVYVPMWKVND